MKEAFKEGIEEGQALREKAKRVVWRGLGMFLGIFKVL